MTTVTPVAWDAERSKLERSLYVFLGVWIGGILVGMIGAISGINAIFWSGAALFLLSVIPYAMTLVHSFRLEEKKNEVQKQNSAAWAVVIGAVVLNPYILGVIIPALVLRSERNVRARLSSVGAQSS